MALIKCPECGGQISDTTEQCIHCGYVLSSKQPVDVPEKVQTKNQFSELGILNVVKIWTSEQATSAVNTFKILASILAVISLIVAMAVFKIWLPSDNDLRGAALTYESTWFWVSILISTAMLMVIVFGALDAFSSRSKRFYRWSQNKNVDIKNAIAIEANRAGSSSNKKYNNLETNNFYTGIQALKNKDGNNTSGIISFVVCCVICTVLPIVLVLQLRTYMAGVILGIEIENNIISLIMKLSSTSYGPLVLLAATFAVIFIALAISNAYKKNAINKFVNEELQSAATGCRNEDQDEE